MILLGIRDGGSGKMIYMLTGRKSSQLHVPLLRVKLSLEADASLLLIIIGAMARLPLLLAICDFRTLLPQNARVLTDIRVLLQWRSAREGRPWIGGHWEKAPHTLVVNRRSSTFHWWSLRKGPSSFGGHWGQDLLTLLVKRRRSTLHWWSLGEGPSYIVGY